MNKVPLTEKPLNKEAFLPAIPPLIWGIGAILGLAGIGGGATAMIRGQQENIAQDSQDLYEQLNDWRGDYPQSETIVNDLIDKSQELAQVCQQMFSASDSKASSTQAITQFQANLSKATQLLSYIERGVDSLIARESISVAQQVKGRVSDLQQSLEDFKKSLHMTGLEVQRHKTEKGPAQQMQQQPSMAVQQRSFRPLSSIEKQQVIDFLNRNYQEGITPNNLDDKLFELAADASKHLGVRVPGDKLQTADINKLRRLFEVLRDPATAVGYTQSEN